MALSTQGHYPPIVVHPVSKTEQPITFPSFTVPEQFVAIRLLASSWAPCVLGDLSKGQVYCIPLRSHDGFNYICPLQGVSKPMEAISTLWHYACKPEDGDHAYPPVSIRNVYYAVLAALVTQVPIQNRNFMKTLDTYSSEWIYTAIHNNNEPALHALLDSGIINMNSKLLPFHIRYPLHAVIRNQMSFNIFNRVLAASNRDTLNSMEFWKGTYSHSEVEVVTWRPLFLLIHNLQYQAIIIETCRCLHALLNRVEIDDADAGLKIIDFESYFYTEADMNYWGTISPLKIPVDQNKPLPAINDFERSLVTGWSGLPRRRYTIDAFFVNIVEKIKEPMKDAELEAIYSVRDRLDRLTKHQRSYPDFLLSTLLHVGPPLLLVPELCKIVASFCFSS